MKKLYEIITTIHRANLLSRAIYSIIKQTIPVSELIIIADASKDNSLNVADKFFGTLRTPCYLIV